jgi:AbrB family looped-hinge helix DNA binding protein
VKASLQSPRRSGSRPSTVKLGVSRQVMIPKKIYEEAGLTPGDFLEVELHDGKIVFTPKVLVDKDKLG